MSTARDITERKRMEEALQESERRYHHLVENSLGPIYTHDLEGELLYVNPAAVHALGYSANEGVRGNLREILAPSVRHLFEDYLARIRHHPTDRGLMCVVTRAGEERIWQYQNVRYEEKGGPCYVIGYAQDITEHKQAEKALRHRQSQLQQLSTELRYAQGIERRRIARELHDGVAQTLSGLCMHVDLLERRVESSPLIRQSLEQIGSATEQALEEVRRLVWILRPAALDDQGLPDALRGLVANLFQSASTDIILRIGASLPPLSSLVETTLYRIVQEALSNVLRHAQASQVTVGLESQEGSLQLVIADNGQGMEGTARSATSQHRLGLGLWSMRERAEEIGGTFLLRSCAGQGTTILVRVPSQLCREKEQGER